MNNSSEQPSLITALHGFSTFSCFPDHSRCKIFFVMVILHEDKNILPFGSCKKPRKHGSLASLKLLSKINIADLDLKKNLNH